ncbi:MAG: hypothetical protein R2941_16565 [Desulfobacterales bacterium]
MRENPQPAERHLQGPDGKPRIAPIFGLYLDLCHETGRPASEKGMTYEPQVFYEKNPAALALEEKGKNPVPARAGISYGAEAADSV